MRVCSKGGRRLPTALALSALMAVVAGRACGEDVWKLTSLSVEQATALAAKQPVVKSGLDGSFWAFDALTTLSPEVAAVLVKPKANLSFNGLTELSLETAKVLATHRGEEKGGIADLRLNGLKSMSPEVAEALAAHEGTMLLYGLERIDSLPLAQKLARQLGELRLGIRELSPEIAAVLAKHHGSEVPKKGVQRYDRAVSVLRIDRLQSLTPEAAEALSAHEGVLVLNDLVSIDPPVAASLAKRVGNRQLNRAGALVLNGLTGLSLESAAALVKFPGELVLKGIIELDPQTAAVLATHKGKLHLTGLERLSPETLAALRSHRAVFLPQPLPK